MRQFDDDDPVDRDAAEEIIDRSNSDHTKEKITFLPDAEGDWKIVVRVPGGEGQSWLYQEVAYHLDPDAEEADEMLVKFMRLLTRQAASVD